VVQWPNISLSVYIVVSIVSHVLRPMGGIETSLRVLSDIVISVWAVDELVRGVNPFRRFLGLAVLITTGVTLLLHVQ
jgi:hypothetical protein